MKTIKRMLIIVMVMVMAILMATAVNAEGEQPVVSANFTDTTIELYATETSFAKIDVVLSTGALISRQVTVKADTPTTTEKIISQGYLDYMQKDGIKIVDVQVSSIKSMSEENSQLSQFFLNCLKILLIVIVGFYVIGFIAVKVNDLK